MGRLVTQICFVAAFGASLCSAAPVSVSLEVLGSPVSVHRGHTTTLPCWLNPPQSAEGLEVRWYRPDYYETPIILYQEKKFASQDASYVGRVSFGLKDAASGGLKAGDVSLKLENVTIEDAGDYICLVSSEQSLEHASVSLMVTEIGTAPLLSVVWEEDNMVNMSCESEGWHPKPTLRWTDQKQVLTPKSLKHSNDPTGLQAVHSWLLVSSSTQVSCSVGISAEETKEARVHLQNPPPSGSGSSVSGWVAFGLLLVAVLGLLGALYYKLKVKKDEPGNDHIDDAEKETLLGQVFQPAATKYYEHITLHEKGNEYLTIKDSRLRDRQGSFPDGEKVTCLTAIRGTPGFTSGQHYWEVSLGSKDPNVGLKQSWWVGVTSETDISQATNFDPTASKGYWFLSSSPREESQLQLSTEPRVSLPISSRPQTVGVYLNCESRELSFYNVENKSLIGSLMVNFTGELFPFFNPGKGDRAVMEIVQKNPDQVQESDTGNSVHTSAQEA